MSTGNPPQRSGEICGFLYSSENHDGKKKGYRKTRYPRGSAKGEVAA
jgi:hypothetical protein